MGNALCPVLAVNRGAVGFGCDFSPTAVACLRAHPQYDAARTRVWVDDITASAGLCGPGKAPERGVDFATLIFVLSAIAPDRMPQVSRRLLCRSQRQREGSGGGQGASALEQARPCTSCPPRRSARCRISVRTGASQHCRCVHCDTQWVGDLCTH